ncbi:hypothetical protein [Pseudomonas viridiflava]|uniref:hypothetical protein n=1 Tax=Pseudomonas viridiflava TaxID=33069 RepID=UPI001E4844BB|nr:hypothetical protein [Pseudomonas viridiflava]
MIGSTVKIHNQIVVVNSDGFIEFDQTEASVWIKTNSVAHIEKSLADQGPFTLERVSFSTPDGLEGPTTVLKVKGQLLTPKQKTGESHRDYPDLDCPICDTSCKPIRLRKDQAVTYACKGGNDKHADRYTWRIAVDGTLID